MNDVITLRAIAGYCPEEAIWKLVADLCDSLTDTTPFLSPDTIWVDDTNFMIGEGKGSGAAAFLPPEYKEGEPLTNEQLIWSVGSIAYYASSGRVPFGGHGGTYQKLNPQAPLPVLQKRHQSLTPIVQRCMQYNPTQRMSRSELTQIAHQELARCRSKIRQRFTHETNTNKQETEQYEKWPEAMSK